MRRGYIEFSEQTAARMMSGLMMTASASPWRRGFIERAVISRPWTAYRGRKIICDNKRPPNPSPHFQAMTDDADFPGFKSLIERWRVEYGRIRKLGDGDYWKGQRLEDDAARSKMSPYALGLADHRAMREAIEGGHEREPISCPFADGTLEKAEYDRGWDALPLLP